MTSVYLRPTAFVDGPGGGAVRLAGGLGWFLAYDVVCVTDGRRRARLVPAADLDREIAGWPGPAMAAAVATVAAIAAPRPALTLGNRTLRFDQPAVAAILNVTPDSFSEGDEHHADPAAAAAAAVDMAASGAAIVDVGGESTRPGAATVWEGDEIARVVPVIERLAASGTLVSIDTRKAAVMEAALAAGAAIVNDVSALSWDERAVAVVARAGCPVVLMHSPDPARGPHGGAGYRDVVIEVFDWLASRIDAVVAAGIDRSNIIVDPGIGFGKSLQDNLALLNNLALFHGLGCPVMLGVSRKRLIGALSNEAPVDDRLGGSLALGVKGIEAGVQLLRVHDVAETVQAIRVWRGLKDAGLIAAAAAAEVADR